MKKILITVALTYANGQLHVGHLLSYVLADINKRFFNLLGNTCYLVTGSDMHGTPIMLAAEKNNVSAEYLANHFADQQKYVIKKLDISFDVFHKTHSDIHMNFLNTIIDKLKKKDLVFKKQIQRPYDIVKNVFLPDRFIIGSCPKCLSEGQYGDSCVACGAVYQSDELIDPVSSLSDCKLEFKNTVHYFFRITQFKDFLLNYTSKLDQSVKKFNIDFLKNIQDWDISRDAPYFGYKIDDNQFFYVWLDAILGYISATSLLTDYKKIWHKSSDFEIIQYIGKDIVYFHTVFWPALLQSLDLKLPSKIRIDNFVTVKGKKMSKSKGTFILAQDCLDKFNASYIRYYFAKRYRNDRDFDFSYDQMLSDCNNGLIGNILNIPSRCCSFLKNNFNNLIIALDCKYRYIFIHKVFAYHADILKSYESENYAKVLEICEQVGSNINKIINQKSPWSYIYSNPYRVHLLCSLAINSFKTIITWLYPIVPTVSDKGFNFLNVKASWNFNLLVDHKIKDFFCILKKIKNV